REPSQPAAPSANADAGVRPRPRGNPAGSGPPLGRGQRSGDIMEQRHGTVLYVDDDEASRHALTSLLRQAGFDVAEAATGREALRLPAAKPDRVALDVNRPDIDGFGVCRRIKSHPSTTAIPVVHMSGVYVTTEDKAHARDEGACASLTKPVEPR